MPDWWPIGLLVWPINITLSCKAKRKKNKKQHKTKTKQQQQKTTIILQVQVRYSQTKAQARERGFLLKTGDGDAWPHLPPFRTHSHPIIPFLIIHNQFLTISHQMPPLLTTFCHIIFNLFLKFLSKMCPDFYCWPLLFWSPHWMTPFFREKSVTNRPLVSSCCSSITSLPKLSALNHQ